MAGSLDVLLIEALLTSLNIMYNISDFLLVPVRNKIYEDAARLHYISTGTSKKSEMLYIAWLNVGGLAHFITVAKSQMYCMGVKSTVSDQYFLLPANTFNFLPRKKM